MIFHGGSDASTTIETLFSLKLFRTENTLSLFTKVSESFSVTLRFRDK